MCDFSLKPKYQIVDECGYRFPPYFSPEVYHLSLLYKPHPDDTFVATYPKCGTTWTQQIVRLILHKGIELETCIHFHTASPCIELYGADSAEHMERPNAIKTHLPFFKTPYSPSAKYIYVARNPKDCCASFYHHTRHFPVYDFANGSFDVFFELFMRGEIDFGDYFDHLLSWYNQKNKPNVHFITFESLKANIEQNIIGISKFIGKEYYDNIQKDPSLLKTIVHKSSFDYMKANGHIFYSGINEQFVKAYLSGVSLPSGIEAFCKALLSAKIPLSSEQGSFLRKGETGSWKTLFTPEQEERLEVKLATVTAGTDLNKLWL